MTTPRLRVILWAAVALLAVGLVLLAEALLESQSSARRDVEERFVQRAQVTASLTEAVFASTAGQAAGEYERLFGGRRVDRRALDELRRDSDLRYVMVLDGALEPIAATRDTPRAVRRRVAGRPPDIVAVRRGASFRIGDVLTDAGEGRPVMEYVVSFDAPVARRVMVQGFDPTAIAPLLSGYLRRVPNPVGARAYILDGRGIVLGARGREPRTGTPVPEPGLAAALRRPSDGVRRFASEGTEHAVVSVPVANTRWRVVMVATSDRLYATVPGGRRLLPWVILGAFALTGALALVLLRRTLIGADRLARTNAELERRAAELQRSNAELEQFAYVASHDLQEPLRKVQTFGDLLARKHADELPDQAQDYLRRMRNAAARMSQLIDDLLAFSRVTTNRRPFARVQLTDVAHEVTQDLEASIAEAGATVQVDPLPAVVADPLQMRQLLQNLVSNAIKFRAPDHPPQVRISGRTEGGEAVVEVADDGIGFDPRYAERIFGVFERLHGREAYEGTGIGLPLCRKIVERHEGRITATSRPGDGATFTIRLPLEHAETDSLPDADASARSPQEPIHA